MQRKISKDLVAWKTSADRKPLILNGARQVGKTWILKEFGEKEFESCAYINCDNNPMVQNLFSDYDVKRILLLISAITNVSVIPGKTLIILDEIQEAPKGLTALKYFCEDAPEYHIVVAGSLLGIQLHEGTGYPVGKVTEIKMYPMDFQEFLQACNKSGMSELLSSKDQRNLSVLKERYMDSLRQYYYVGGMPEAVSCFASTQDLKKTREIQNQIIEDYRRDFAKHIPSSILSKVNMVWDSIPAQLAKENKKFIYSFLKKGGRAKEFEDAIQWLIDAGLIYRVNVVSKIAKPLRFYEEFGAFKLFLCDLGLLGALSDVSAGDVLVNDTIFEEYKGSFTEQYVAQQLISEGIKVYYYTNENSTVELDFLIQAEEIYPIEVKAAENLRSKSLHAIIDKNPGLLGIRFSMSDYREQDWMINLPLYSVLSWIHCIQKK